MSYSVIYSIISQYEEKRNANFSDYSSILSSHSVDVAKMTENDALV